MWNYTVTTGAIEHDGEHMGAGYSGRAEGLNNPDMESTHAVGPIPRGEWKLGPWHDHVHLGPCVSQLTPVGHDAHGRTEFFVHGDNAYGSHTASHGCIILGPAIRHAMRDSHDDLLTVM